MRLGQSKQPGARGQFRKPPPLQLGPNSRLQGCGFYSPKFSYSNPTALIASDCFDLPPKLRPGRMRVARPEKRKRGLHEAIPTRTDCGVAARSRREWGGGGRLLPPEGLLRSHAVPVAA